MSLIFIYYTCVIFLIYIYILKYISDSGDVKNGRIQNLCLLWSGIVIPNFTGSFVVLLNPCGLLATHWDLGDTNHAGPKCFMALEVPQEAPGHTIGSWEVSECSSAGSSMGLEPNAQSLGGTEVTPAATATSPCWGFQGEAALSFQPWLFLFCLHFITLCYPFLKHPPQLSRVLSLAVVPTLGILSLPAACGCMSIPCPASGCLSIPCPASGCLSIPCPVSECHHFCCGLGRVEPLAHSQDCSWVRVAHAGELALSSSSFPWCFHPTPSLISLKTVPWWEGCFPLCCVCPYHRHHFLSLQAQHFWEETTPQFWV